MAFVMSPMSTAAMNAVEPTKAGVASGILSMNRMVGGTFGVAVLGALVSTLGASKLGELLPRVPAATRSTLTAGLGAGTPAHGIPAHVAQAGHEAFVYALQNGLRLGAAVAFVGAIVAWTLIGRDKVPVAAGIPAASAAAETRLDGAELDAAKRTETVGV
jgi:hypothetical protein